MSVKSMKDRMPCNKPTRANDGKHDYKVKACKDGKEKIVRYGDASMPNRPDEPGRRKAFRDRHNCDKRKTNLKLDTGRAVSQLGRFYLSPCR